MIKWKQLKNDIIINSDTTILVYPREFVPKSLKDYQEVKHNILELDGQYDNYNVLNIYLGLNTIVLYKD